jgi:hypothetical protein
MKKILVCLSVLIAYVAVSYSAATTTLVAGNFNMKPSNVAVYTLGDNAKVDSVYTSAGRVIYGPYNLSVDGSRLHFKGFRAYMPVGGLASGDSVQLLYQLLGSGSINDTCTSWSVADTLINGKKGTYQDISSLCGVSIVFKIVNIDAAKVGLLHKTKVVLIDPSNR